MEITREIAEKVLAVVDAGLVRGVGISEPGEMCVEAAICYALGEPHGDYPSCVDPVLRNFKIRLNDARWPSPDARAKGMRRLALVQLGSKDNFNQQEFTTKVAELAIRKAVPFALRNAAAKMPDGDKKTALLDAALRCEREGTKEAALNAKTAADAAYAAAADAAYAAAADAAYAAANAANAAYAAVDAVNEFLSQFAEATVQILIEMKVPGVQWLDLAPPQ